MLFELIDSKLNCNSCYVDGTIKDFQVLQEPTHTWDYSPSFADKKMELACLYAGTKSIEDACSHELRERYLSLRFKLRAYMKSFITAQVSMDENCFFDLVPVSFIHELFSTRAAMLKNVFDTHKKPDNYDFLYNLNKMLHEVAEKEVKVEMKNLPLIGEIKNASKMKKKVKYNLFGTVTGRLSAEQDSFPILTMNKNLRCIVEPTNDFLLELDYNAFEPRVLLALNGKKQPSADLHEWNKDNVFLGTNRDGAKKKFLAWMYDERGTTTLPPQQDKKVKMFYDKNIVRGKYYDGGVVKNYYGREIKADNEHAINYILQSTASDIFLRQAIKINDLLKGKKTFIKFLIHDSVVLDVSSEDKQLIKDICNTFSATDFGKFVITKKVGKNYGEMKQL
jgi:hypothetical protein